MIVIGLRVSMFFIQLGKKHSFLFLRKRQKTTFSRNFVAQIWGTEETRFMLKLSRFLIDMGTPTHSSEKREGGVPLFESSGVN